MAELFYVVKCPRCSGISVTRARTAYRCPFCGLKVSVDETTVLHVARDAKRAREVASRLKVKGSGSGQTE
ncbi:MAG: hypothetical protein NZ733_01005 [Aigarchaeota archaeon]|nr:hypothetical protein [Aigarchaeota archaeon]MCX8203096.1 hypothetical protein [Nitrososphaeria archaeon]MDW8043418.1 hypothetical protein [Nitrososphaerota archaeon]